MREDIVKPRSPQELGDFVEQVSASVRADMDEIHAGNSRRGYYKEFLDEVVPLARFTLHLYDNSHTIEPVLGNQGFDAIVRDSKGCIVDKIEIANPIDGASISAIAREVAQKGYGGIMVYDPGEEIEELIPIIERTAQSKATKDYSDTTVVFNISALPPFKGFEAQHEEQIARIRNILVQSGFNAKRIFLMHPPDRIEQIRM